MSFSERMGIAEPKAIQIDSLDAATRSSLWNVCRSSIFYYSKYTLSQDHLISFAISLYSGFYKEPVDNIPSNSPSFVNKQLQFFLTAKWYRVLDLVEFISINHRRPPERQTFEKAINIVLETEKSAFRFVGGAIVPLSNHTEIGEVTDATTLKGNFEPVAIHMSAALECFGRKPVADYRNCIKEAISAVEAAAIIATGHRATLGDALKKIPMHEAFRQSMLKLYGYTSAEGGIRHALSDAATIDESDARYMLVTCSACANFISSKYAFANY